MKNLSDMTIRELVEYYGDLSAGMRDYEGANNIFNRAYENLENKARAIIKEAQRRDAENRQK